MARALTRGRLLPTRGAQGQLWPPRCRARAARLYYAAAAAEHTSPLPTAPIALTCAVTLAAATAAHATATAAALAAAAAAAASLASAHAPSPTQVAMALAALAAAAAAARLAPRLARVAVRARRLRVLGPQHGAGCGPELGGRRTAGLAKRAALHLVRAATHR